MRRPREPPREVRRHPARELRRRDLPLPPGAEGVAMRRFERQKWLAVLDHAVEHGEWRLFLETAFVVTQKAITKKY